MLSGAVTFDDPTNCGQFFVCRGDPLLDELRVCPVGYMAQTSLSTYCGVNASCNAGNNNNFLQIFPILRSEYSYSPKSYEDNILIVFKVKIKYIFKIDWEKVHVFETKSKSKT